ncbi:hypothetical protein A2631_04655 [Candidatus Daviesbacteria bacterium RIFCSPHIGHO2_01_FULL_44_29]|uniref:Uncharacterized protein n=1 Tax=Candidatus Daviesbacteria bacterium RIFCSPHIGHO2_02_FULL_43_12 TaxID=1797776 RepID=A0A1F5KHC4_9BACT|nr:MAG: hypothetical protein A2631_04655 [Candidatus Daviesbacteria bacterium RIFCSPHIGHO2_01_FULL_44_29]OGE40011.1 MAG: hypothetical protein A3D25_04385 [Candidatus Daviesbacteria bacterium RIFCSPHIGHO2_02_FULL_43_12]OGE41505.1 MAG: hypothetical protein A3E86_05425 [Candidatus Daviesbacteria bacterium RIFCSPHIGHO2_12_FULL_47_45]OGE70308.1 MAG: hypothetical protein A3B55_01185 [Candidatus Daviesbacteria bacterium RIFCSPLOWO2_01_FULL_43_15]
MNPYYSRYYTFVKPLLRNKYVQSYSSITFSLVLIIVFVIFAIKPTLVTIIALERSIDQQTQVLQELKDKGVNLSRGKDNYLSLDRDLRNTMENLIPNTTDVTGIISSLNNLSLAGQASVSGIQVQPTELTIKGKVLKKNSTLAEVFFTLNILTTYQQAVSFLDALVTSPRLFAIDSISMGARKDTDGLLVTINGRAFVLP